jgi:CRISPR-associated protein Cmr4
MHVGSGGANYGIVDNLVQRDSISNVPTINASSLKGALREFFKNKWTDDDSRLKYIFGHDTKRDSSNEAGVGHYKFFNADLLVLPVRSNKKPFYRATAEMLVETINNKSTAFNKSILITGNYNYTNPTIKEGRSVRLEDWNAKIDSSLLVDANMGNDVAVFDSTSFKILSKKLPVIARNQLENGESKNLWYEEVIPRESRFVFFVSEAENHQPDFEDVLKDAIVQIGANASIGYGYCKITKIS